MRSPARLTAPQQSTSPLRITGLPCVVRQLPQLHGTTLLSQGDEWVCQQTAADRARIKPAAPQIVDTAAAGLHANDVRDLIGAQDSRKVWRKPEHAREVLEGFVRVLQLDITAPPDVEVVAQRTRSMQPAVMIRRIS